MRPYEAWQWITCHPYHGKRDLPSPGVCSFKHNQRKSSQGNIRVTKTFEIWGFLLPKPHRKGLVRDVSWFTYLRKLFLVLFHLKPDHSVHFFVYSLGPFRDEKFSSEYDDTEFSKTRSSRNLEIIKLFVRYCRIM